MGSMTLAYLVKILHGRRRSKQSSGAAGGVPKGGAGKAIGGFLGGMGEGVMKGAAAGLSAFGKGSVSILLGATTVAGVITAIGAGIAAAAWLTGKALPSFVSGIKEFESLDGTKLADAASGMLAIRGAMAYLVQVQQLQA